MRTVAFLSVLAFTASCKRTRATPSEPVTSVPRVGVGGACAVTDACQAGLVCAHNGTCAVDGALGTALEGEDCRATVACSVDLVCNADRLCAEVGSAGTAAFGDVCAGNEDCQGGLSCYDDACLGFDVPVLEALECPLDGTVGTDEQPYRILHGRQAVAGDDFFQTPFPSNARVQSDVVDLMGFPAFGELPIFGDVGAEILSDFAGSFDGYGANATLFMRITDLPDPRTVKIGEPLPIVGDPNDPVNATRGTIGLIDVTEGDAFGTLVATGWSLRTHQPYHCDPWMALYPVSGQPLRPGHTYAAFVTRGLLGPEGVELAVDPDFQALVDAGGSGAAWNSYAPMRSYIASKDIDVDTLRGGVVFTVADHRAAGEGIRARAANADVPSADQVVVCGDLPGPHADVNDPTRGCFGENPAFHEVQGVLEIPHIQSGSPPFLTSAAGGTADWSLGSPEIQESRDVTFALTAPTGTPPAEGWPIVLYASDAGGNYRSFVEEGLAARWSAIDTGHGTAGFVVVSIDTWLTGPRFGTPDPTWVAQFPAGIEESLAYDNPLHPAAARDNLAQSAIDWHTVIRHLDGLDWSTTSPTGQPLPLDTNRIWVVGQGTGGRAVPLVAAYEPRVKGVVMAATGGLWSDMFVDRTEPVDPSILLAPAIGDPKLDRFQPIVSIGQQLIDRTDPVNHGRFVQFEADVNRDVLVVVGDDPRVGRTSAASVARGLFVQQVVQDGATAIERLATTSAPASANIAGSTAVAVVNVASNPHRLLFDNPRTIVQVDHFLGTAALDGRATVPFIP